MTGRRPIQLALPGTNPRPFLGGPREPLGFRRVRGRRRDAGPLLPRAGSVTCRSSPDVTEVLARRVAVAALRASVGTVAIRRSSRSSTSAYSLAHAHRAHRRFRTARGAPAVARRLEDLPNMGPRIARRICGLGSKPTRACSTMPAGSGGRSTARTEAGSDRQGHRRSRSETSTKIRAHGGEVVFVRAPSAGLYYESRAGRHPARDDLGPAAARDRQLRHPLRGLPGDAGTRSAGVVAPVRGNRQRASPAPTSPCCSNGIRMLRKSAG